MRAIVANCTQRVASNIPMPTSDQPVRIFDSRGKTGYTYSVYLQDAWRVWPTVTINGGLRLDGLEAFTSEWQLSPRLNVVWEATPTTCRASS